MGCSSSKNVDVYPSVKKPVPQSPPNDDAHLVALTSSTYGFLRVDSHKRSSADEAPAVAEDDPVREVYQRMLSLDSCSQQPQSWSEVNNVLTQLKSQAQNKKSCVAPTGRTALAGSMEPQTVDVSKLLQSVDDAPSRALTKAVSAPPPPRAQHKRDLSVIHTLEEVDQLAQSNSAATSQDGGTSDTESEDDFFRHSTLPSSRTNPASKNRFSMSSVVTRQDKKSKVPGKSSKSLSTYTGEARQVDSTLFDAEFLESFKEAFDQLSAGVPTAAPAGKHAVSQPQPKATAQTKAMIPFQTADREEKVALSKVPAATAAIGRPAQLPLQQQQQPQVQPQQEDETKKQEDEAKPRGTVQNQVASWNSKSQQNVGSQPIHHKKPQVPPPPPDPLQHFPKKCPPDGENKAVLYSTSLRGIRKTFEDCNTVRNILHSINVELDERDVSMDSQFRQELKDLMDKPVPVPQLFIKGRYIGGVEEVLQAHESGGLVKMLQGLPQGNLSRDCDGCGGMRFIPCTDCSGSCKSVGPGGRVVKCPECNENGLVRCPICS